jgi:hypothetical protein
MRQVDVADLLAVGVVVNLGPEMGFLLGHVVLRERAGGRRAREAR